MAKQAQKDRLIAALTKLGGSAGNGRLRDVLQWGETTYDAVKDELVAEGVLGKGRGRGGSLFLIDGAAPEVDKADDDSTDLPEEDDDDEEGSVTLLKAQMNTDLLTEDLKKARSSNQSFWLMGQPDVELRKRDDEHWEVEVHGFDYFDPKAGELVSGGKSKIAMWALDVDYDQRSLLPHQVFFPMAGAKDGWNRLRKTIRDELDEELLEQFHGTVSLPFLGGDNKRIAVKIVDDRGIESLKIMSLDT